MSIYVAGGMYEVKFGLEEFHLVRPHGNNPCYVTQSCIGLRTTSHHASLYRVDDKGDYYELVKVQNRYENSPELVKFEKATVLGQYLTKSLEYAKKNWKYYS